MRRWRARKREAEGRKERGELGVQGEIMKQKKAWQEDRKEQEQYVAATKIRKRTNRKWMEKDLEKTKVQEEGGAESDYRAGGLGEGSEECD